MATKVRAIRVAALIGLCALGAIHCGDDTTPDGGDTSEPTGDASDRDAIATRDGDAATTEDKEAGADATVQPTPKAVPYTNPVFDKDFPDPAIIRTGGVFHAFATGGLIQHATSTDLVHWTFTTDALAQKPSWADQKDAFWAPDIIAADGKFFLYFSAEQNTGEGSHCVGVATSTSITGSFVDVGQPIVCSSDFAAIDPHAYDAPSGKHLLYWGSAFAPIHVRELAANRTEFAAGSVTADVVTTSGRPYESLVEGAWLHARGGYAYLFYSGDNCCGDEAHYAVMVARATNALGPFEGLVTTGASDNTILVANATWNAPGHNAIVTDDVGDDWILYHAIDRADPGSRKLMLDKITYTNGWPSVAGKTPSTTMQTGPMIAVP